MLDAERTRLAEAFFKAEVATGRIQFRLRTDGIDWRMPFEAETFEREGARLPAGRDRGPLTRSLFSPIYEGDFSSEDERDIVVYLDGEAALRWWHRNVARVQYGVQGWRKDKIYPDFIFAVRREESSARMVILEAKGQHLAGSLDSEYKRAVLKLLSDNFSWERVLPAGELELVYQSGDTVECDMVLMNEWRTKLPHLLGSGAEVPRPQDHPTGS